MSPRISVIMPALNEAQNIQRAVRNALTAFEKVGCNGEVIVVNDGSTDETPSLVEALTKHHANVRMLSHARPMGIGRSFWDGVQTATGEIVTMLPGDAENDGYEILRYLPLTDHVDLVVPFVFNKGQRSFARQIISSLYRNGINLLFGTSLNYMNGTVLYRRHILKTVHLKSPGFFYQTELLIRCIRAGYLYAEVPYGLMQREKGKSKALTFSSLRRLIIDFIRLKFDLTKEAAEPLSPLSLSAKRCAEFPNQGVSTQSGLLLQTQS